MTKQPIRSKFIRFDLWVLCARINAKKMKNSRSEQSNKSSRKKLLSIVIDALINRRRQTATSSVVDFAIDRKMSEFLEIEMMRNRWNTQWNDKNEEAPNSRFAFYFFVELHWKLFNDFFPFHFLFSALLCSISKRTASINSSSQLATAVANDVFLLALGKCHRMQTLNGPSCAHAHIQTFGSTG